MANTIPKLKINPDALHRARRTLQSKQPGNTVQLSAAEREAVLQLIQKGKRRLYPDPADIDSYNFALDMVGKINPHEKPALFNGFLHDIERFEQKYCE